MKPLIGINLDILEGPPAIARVRCDYFESILNAGGVPVLIPPMPDRDLDQILSTLGGLMLIGGLDYSPKLYGEDPCQAVELIHHKREQFDLQLVRRAFQGRDLPVLGICAGCQVLNISLGGSLIQDIHTDFPESDVKHATPKDGSHNGGVHKHHIELEEGTRLSGIYKTKALDVPSNHHQAVKTLGQGLKAAARAEDGIIEAFEDPKRVFTVGVQWHPERDFTMNQALFREFVTQASKMTVST
jgi:putative glutamine amidotransferase